MGGSLRIETQQRPSWLIGGDLSKQPSRHVVYINSTEQWSSASISVNSRVFLKRRFEKKQKKTTQYATGGDLGRIYPEGEDDQTSLGGPQRHLKFGKN